MPLKLLACQILVPETAGNDEKLAHVERASRTIDAIVSRTSVDVVVLPELCSISYSRETFARLDELAEALDGETSRLFGRLAKRHGVHVVFGMPRVEDGRFFISQVVLGPDGTRKGHYDKLHIAQYGASMEKEFFARGDHLFVFDIGPYRIAPIICYDIRIPELARTLCVDQGVNLLLHCGAYARDESFASWHNFAVTRAMENQVYLVSLSRAGAFYGASIFCPPWVDEDHPAVVLPKEETLRVFDIDIGVLTETRASYPFLSDRLSEYRKLDVRMDACASAPTNDQT